MVLDQAKFHKLLDDMEQATSNLKSGHFKNNLKHLHYIYLLSLAYFVGSSTRIVNLNKWVSGQRLKDNEQMPRPNNVSWRGNSGRQDGGYTSIGDMTDVPQATPTSLLDAQSDDHLVDPQIDEPAVDIPAVAVPRQSNRPIN
uniref:Uncharacterized protein n=1 Tax=Solanum tuberosum TaxID=4113 RepID=M1DXB5_SOLTU